MGRISVTADQLTALGAASICNTSYGGFLGNIYYCTKKGEPLTGKMPRADGEGVYYKLGELGNHPEGVSSYDRLGREFARPPLTPPARRA